MDLKDLVQSAAFTQLNGIRFGFPNARHSTSARDENLYGCPDYIDRALLALLSFERGLNIKGIQEEEGGCQLGIRLEGKRTEGEGLKNKGCRRLEDSEE